MGREYEAEKRFTESLDDMLSGQGAQTGTNADTDLQTALVFANQMVSLRPELSPQFQAHLKATLLEKLDVQESKKQGWFWRLIPHEPVWQTVAVMVIILVVGGVVWSTFFRPEGNPPIVVVPTITVPATITAPATTAAPVTSAAVTATSPVVVPGMYLAAAAGTDKSAYVIGEKVNIELSLTNVTAQPFVLEKSPPIVSLMHSTDGRPVYTFTAGSTGKTLAPGETATFSMVWDQVDSNGRTVSPGKYYIELEDIDFQGSTLKMRLAQPVSFQILY